MNQATTPTSFTDDSWSSAKSALLRYIALSPSEPIDHLKHSNPCLSLRGSTWRKKIKTVPALLSHYDIQDMIDHA